jgi:hypothetical protein
MFSHLNMAADQLAQIEVFNLDPDPELAAY